MLNRNNAVLATTSVDQAAICFERLLLGAKYPDDSFAMISAVRRTYDLEIHGVSEEMLRQMPEDLVMP